MQASLPETLKHYPLSNAEAAAILQISLEELNELGHRRYIAPSQTIHQRFFSNEEYYSVGDLVEYQAIRFFSSTSNKLTLSAVRKLVSSCLDDIYNEKSQAWAQSQLSLHADELFQRDKGSNQKDSVEFLVERIVYYLWCELIDVTIDVILRTIQHNRAIRE